MSAFPQTRLRRLRRTPSLRRLFDQPVPGPEKFIWPVFVKNGEGCREPIEAMPGQQRMSPDVLLEELQPVVESGIGGILIFGLPEADRKTPDGVEACRDENVVQTAVRAVRCAYPDLVICTDVCLCAYTSHGHCGPLTPGGAVDNDAANAMLARTALSHAAAGADIVAPSAMMDGQVAAIRRRLDENGHADTLIMSYSSKFASNMYGPFREAEQSAPSHGDRKSYQASYADPRAALRESALDEAEGADILMVKPALFYLDILALAAGAHGPAHRRVQCERRVLHAHRRRRPRLARSARHRARNQRRPGPRRGRSLHFLLGEPLPGDVSQWLTWPRPTISSSAPNG